MSCISHILGGSLTSEITKEVYNKVKTKLDAGIDPNYFCVNCDTPLVTAIHFSYCDDYIDIVKLLLEYGADPNLRKSSLYNTPLMEAVIRNNLEIVTLIRQHDKFNSSLVYGYNGYTAFMMAIDYNYSTIVKALIDYGEDPCIPSKVGRTPFQLATSRPTSIIILDLLKNTL